MYREIKREEIRVHKILQYEYFQDINHPLTANSGFVYYHRHIASIIKDRWLSAEEHVHHIDGNRQNNLPDNLQVLTAKEHGHLHKGTILSRKCKECDIPFTPKYKEAKYCSQVCRLAASTKLKFLTKEELEYLIWTQPFTTVAKQFSCSANGIRKWAHRLGCIMPPYYFHNKIKSLEDKLVVYSKFKEENAASK